MRGQAGAAPARGRQPSRAGLRRARRPGRWSRHPRRRGAWRAARHSAAPARNDPDRGVLELRGCARELRCKVVDERARLLRVCLPALRGIRHKDVDESWLEPSRARRQPTWQQPAVVEMIVAEGDARRHAAEVLLQGDARVAKRRLREVKDGALGKQLLHIRVAGAQQPSLEVGDTRLRYKGGGRRDLLLVANHQHARAAQQRQDGSYVGLRRLVDNDQVERADGRRQALGDAPRGHDPAGDGGGAVGERRGEVGPVARGARRVGTHASRVGNGRDEAHQPSACLGRHGGAERLLGGCGDERAHGRLALKQTPLRRTSRRARRA
eukprot:scaffold49067_cov25-Tisochrysis_lutea.AAC.2